MELNQAEQDFIRIMHEAMHEAMKVAPEEDPKFRAHIALGCLVAEMGKNAGVRYEVMHECMVQLHGDPEQWISPEKS